VYTRCVASVDFVTYATALVHGRTTHGREHLRFSSVIRVAGRSHSEEDIMGFGRGALLWLLGVPLPIILLLALFWHH
jgi:hypothetical protein